MNGKQLAHLLSMDPATSMYYKGMAMKDSESLPFPHADPALYIVNTGRMTSQGEHWCAVLFQGNDEEFFDPFGMPSVIYGFENLFGTREMQVREKTYNGVCVQHPASAVCGHHCLFYAFHRCRGYGLEKILKMYDRNDLEKNDKMAMNFVVQFGSAYYPRW